MNTNQIIGVITILVALFASLIIFKGILNGVKKSRSYDERNQMIKVLAKSESWKFTLIWIIVLYGVTPFASTVGVNVFLGTILIVQLLSWTGFMIFFAKKY